jgi:hypothetical protein
LQIGDAAEELGLLIAEHQFDLLVASSGSSSVELFI